MEVELKPCKMMWLINGYCGFTEESRWEGFIKLYSDHWGVAIVADPDYDKNSLIRLFDAIGVESEPIKVVVIKASIDLWRVLKEDAANREREAKEKAAKEVEAVLKKIPNFMT